MPDTPPETLPGVPGSLPDAPADLLIVNGRVFVGGDPRLGGALPVGSCDGRAPDGAPDAMAVRDGRIAWVGRSSDSSAWRGPSTDLIDAAGGLIGPGFEDAHLHFRMGAVGLLLVDLDKAASVDDVRRILADWDVAHPRTEWLIGRGWHYGIFPGGMPDRALLDALVPDRPAVLECFDGHTHWLNSAALARLGITGETPDSAEGSVARDPITGEPSGILKEFGERLSELLPAPPEERLGWAIRQAVALAQRHGITAVQEAWTEIADLRRYARLGADTPLGLHLRVALPADPRDWEDGIERGRRRWRERLASYGAELASLQSDGWLSGGIVKVFADGVIESGTAWMLTPYEPSDDIPAGATGRPNWSADSLAAMTALAVDEGWQVEIHAIGDAAIRASLDAHAAAANVVRGRPAFAVTRGRRAPPARNGGEAGAPSAAGGVQGRAPRGRIEHVEWPDPADVPRFGREGVIASMQPSHASPVWHKTAVRERRIGLRIERGWPWASILRAGALVAFGSDWPIASLDPLIHLRAAVTRSDPDGQPEEAWLPHERLTISTALACSTWGSAFAAFGEDRRGTVAVGRPADLVVLDRDLLAGGPDKIAGTRVLATILGGGVVYRAG
jgi:predicted amidohydrolase YtcJ